MKKNIKKGIAFLVFISLIGGAGYANDVFINGHLYAATDEKVSTVENSHETNLGSSENTNEEKNQESSSVTELEERPIDLVSSQQAREISGRAWEGGSRYDTISNAEYKIEWNGGALWWYTYNGNKWLYNKNIEANLIIDDISGTDQPAYGMLWDAGGISSSTYSINKKTKSLKRTFVYLQYYKVDVIQQLLENNAVEITYTVTNLQKTAKKIGITQYADVFVGRDDVPVTPINKFKGINLSYGNSSLVILPDSKTMPNWAAGSFSRTFGSLQYSTQNSVGLGWETGKRYRDSSGYLYSSPVNLKENIPIGVGDSAITMKNPGVTVGSNESISFKQILKYGVLAAPKVTLNQKKASIYQDEQLVIDGTISDADNMGYRLYLELDDKAKTLVPLAEYTNIPYNEVQNYQGIIEGKLFSPGVHTVSVVGIDDYGTRSVAQKLELTITELKATPTIQKVKIGEAISNDLKTLFKDIQGTNVTLKNPLSIDSSAIGFQWVKAVLTDGKKELALNIPVNVFNPGSTLFNDTDNIALDAKDVGFVLAEVRQSNEKGLLDELVRQKVEPKAWGTADGTEIPVALTVNGIKPLFGTYSGTFKATKADSGKSLQKNSKLTVAGELKFKNLPKNLEYKTTKLSQKTTYVERMKSDWKIEIENTIGSNWTLYASATPFENEAKEKLSSALVLKKNQTQEVDINATSQKIAAGSEDYPMIQWPEKGGLLLKLNPDAKVGSFTSEVTWTLSDAP